MNAQAETVEDRERVRDIPEALQQLRTKLLNLRERNRLLDFKHTLDRSHQSIDDSSQAIYNPLVEQTGRSAMLIRGVAERPRSTHVARASFGKLAS